MRIWVLTSSVLTIAGGALFLVLPIMILNGAASIDYPPGPPICGHCLVPLYHPPPRGMLLFWTSLGIIGIILGVFALILGPKPRVGLALGLSFSLGSMALLFWIVTREILGTFIVTPSSLLLFPELASVAMVGATLLFSYELARRGREVITAITS